MKTKLIVTLLSLAVMAHAHGTTPEAMTHLVIKDSRAYVPEASDITTDYVDYEALQEFDPSLTKDCCYTLLKSVDSEDIVLTPVEEPPYDTVVEMTKPKQVRFYFKKQKSNQPSPHDPKYHEEWDYILIGFKIMESSQRADLTRTEQG